MRRRLHGCISETYVAEQIFPEVRRVLPFDGKSIYKRRAFIFSPPFFVFTVLVSLPPPFHFDEKSRMYGLTLPLYARHGCRLALFNRTTLPQVYIKSCRCMKFTLARPADQQFCCIKIRAATRKTTARGTITRS